MPENQRFSELFGEYRNGTLTWKGSKNDKKTLREKNFDHVQND